MIVVCRRRRRTSTEQPVFFGEDASLFGELPFALLQCLLALIELRGAHVELRAR